MFLDPRAAGLLPRWNRAAADDVVACSAPRPAANPDDRALTELIGELTTRSERFTARWATHNVRWHTAPAPSASTTASSATSPSPTRPSSSPATPARPHHLHRRAGPPAPSAAFLASWANSTDQPTDQHPVEQPKAR